MSEELSILEQYWFKALLHVIVRQLFQYILCPCLAISIIHAFMDIWRGAFTKFGSYESFIVSKYIAITTCKILQYSGRLGDNFKFRWEDE